MSAVAESWRPEHFIMIYSHKAEWFWQYNSKWGVIIIYDHFHLWSLQICLFRSRLSHSCVSLWVFWPVWFCGFDWLKLFFIEGHSVVCAGSVTACDVVTCLSVRFDLFSPITGSWRFMRSTRTWPRNESSAPDGSSCSALHLSLWVIFQTCFSKFYEHELLFCTAAEERDKCVCRGRFWRAQRFWWWPHSSLEFPSESQQPVCWSLRESAGVCLQVSCWAFPYGWWS